MKKLTKFFNLILYRKELYIKSTVEQYNYKIIERQNILYV